MCLLVCSCQNFGFFLPNGYFFGDRIKKLCALLESDVSGLNLEPKLTFDGCVGF